MAKHELYMTITRIIQVIQDARFKHAIKARPVNADMFRDHLTKWQEIRTSKAV